MQPDQLRVVNDLSGGISHPRQPIVVQLDPLADQRFGGDMAGAHPRSVVLAGLLDCVLFNACPIRALEIVATLALPQLQLAFLGQLPFLQLSGDMLHHKLLRQNMDVRVLGQCDRDIFASVSPLDDTLALLRPRYHVDDANVLDLCYRTSSAVRSRWLEVLGIELL